MRPSLMWHTFYLKWKLTLKIDPKGDPVSSDSNILEPLRIHHRSILEHIQYRLGSGDVSQPYAIENSWTMNVEDTISTLQRLREDNREDWETVVEKGKEEGARGGSETKNLCSYVIISCTRQLKNSDGCWMRNMSSGLHVEWR
jgi:hypothetical protein